MYTPIPFKYCIDVYFLKSFSNFIHVNTKQLKNPIRYYRYGEYCFEDYYLPKNRFTRGIQDLVEARLF